MGNSKNKRGNRKSKKNIAKSMNNSIKFSVVFMFAMIFLVLLTLSINADINGVTGSSILEPIQKNAWNLIQNENYIGGEALFTNTPGSSLEYEFNASSVQIFTQKREDFGIMNIDIDDQNYKIDLYSEETKYNASYDFDLVGDEHKLVVSVDDEKNNLSTDYYVLVDEVVAFLNAVEKNNETLDEDTIPIITENYLVILTQAEDLDYQGLWFETQDSAYSGDASLISNYPGDSLEFEFSGNNIYILTEKRDDFGVANVSIDDISYLVDFYSQESIKPYLISINELSDSDHLMKIQVTDLVNKDSNDKYIVIDGFLQSKIGDLSEYDLFDINGIQIDEITETLYEKVEIVDANASNIAETIIEPEIIKINEPVKWTKTVTVNESTDNITIELPKEVVNISIKKIDEFENEELVEDEKVKVVDENKEVKEISEFVKEKQIHEIEREINLKKEFDQDTNDLEKKKEKLEKEKPRSRGMGIQSNEVEEVVVDENINVDEENEEETELIITEEITKDDELEIEYYTEAPIAVENNLSSTKKEVLISSETHYENILAYTYVDDVPLSSVKIYRTTDGGRELVELYSHSDLNNNSLIDYVEWIVPHLSNQTYEIEIVVLNVQSYPVVGGNWTVEFTTSGIANLTIAASNGTTWDNVNEDNDLKFLDLKCGDVSIDYEWIDGSVFVQDYECDETSYEVSKVLTPGKHTIMFSFGDQVVYARNAASINSCRELSSGVYQLSQNVRNESTCFHVTGNDVTLDCQGYRVEGNGEQFGDTTYGINITARTGINITNCTIFNFTAGIYALKSNHSHFNKLNLTNNSGSGISSSRSINNSVFLSSIYYSGSQGISLDESHNYTIYNNTFENPTGGGGGGATNTDVKFQMMGGSNSGDTLIYLNTFLDWNSISNSQNADRLGINNSNYGNFWTSYDEPIEGCYDTNVDGICDDAYNFTAQSGAPGGGSDVVDFLPIRSTSITAGTIMKLQTDIGSGQNNDSDTNGYILPNGVGNYFFEIINSQAISDEIVINTTNYGNIGGIVLNQSSFTSVPAYGKVAFEINVTDSTIGTYIVGINLSTDGKDYDHWFNLTTYVIEAFGENTTWGANLVSAYGASMISADVDNDTRPDLIMFGQNENSNISSWVYTNDGLQFNLNFTWSVNFTNYSTMSSSAAADFNNDGWIDVIVFGSDGNNPQCNVYINNQSSFIQNLTWEQNLTAVQNPSVATSDIDLDGKIDLVVIGEDSGSNKLLKVYVNNGSSFNEDHGWQKNFTTLGTEGFANLMDIDNDGYLDLIMSAEDDVSNIVVEVYISNKTTFVYNSSYTNGFNSFMSPGGGGTNNIYAAPADYNNDGLMDIALIGQSGSTAIFMYFNNQTSFNYNESWTDGVTFGTNIGMIYAGDYNNNGFIDLITLSPSTSTGDGVYLFNNTGSAITSDTTFAKFLPDNINMLQSGSGLFVDVDSDNNLDLVLFGAESSGAATTAYQKIFTNRLSTTNNAPGAPDTFANTYIGGGDPKLNISWSGATDTEGGRLYYNVKVGTASGDYEIIRGIKSSSNLPAQGMYGNAQHQTYMLVNTSNATTYWAVQTIDSSLKASAWSAEQTYTPPVVDTRTSLSACQNLSTPGKHYRLTQDVQNDSTCFTITADNITLDCDGYQITGNETPTGDFSYSGFNITNTLNTTINNCTIINFTYGIYMYNANVSYLTNLTVINNTGSGIYLTDSHNNTIKTSTIKDNPGYGVIFYNMGNNNIFENNTFSNMYSSGDIIDIRFDCSAESRCASNKFYGNSFNSSASFSQTTNSEYNIMNNSRFGNQWLSKDEPTQACYDSDSNGICDDVYNFSAEGVGQDGQWNDIIDYLPLRSTSITANISLILVTSSGAGQYNDANYDGYSAINDIGTYYVDIINSAETAENITLNLSNYGGFDILSPNASSFASVPAYSKISFAVNISKSALGSFILGINATTNSTGYNDWLNLTTFVIEAFAESTAWQKNLVGSGSTGMVVGDFNNDGLLDLFASGQDFGASTYITNVYINDGSTFSPNYTWSQNITNLSTPSIAAADINNDGWLDLIATGSESISGGNTVASTKVYINNQSMFVQNLTWSQNITPKQSASIGVGDIDRDGDIDFVMIGVNDSMAMPAQGIESKVYINNGSTFNEDFVWEGNLTDMYMSNANGVTLIDINNDSYLDLFLIGEDGTSVFTEFYINNETAFVYNSSYSLGMKSYESDGGMLGLYSAFADYNNDGWIDVAMIGQISGTKYFDIYLNNQSSFNYNATWNTSVNPTAACLVSPVDYDSDGDMDIVFIPSAGQQESFVLYNNSGSNFNIDTTYAKMLPSSQSVSGVIIDINSDNDPDLITMGQDSSSNYYGKVFINSRSSSNTVPIAPTSFNQGYGTSLDLNWSGASDSEGGMLFYNLRVGTSSAGDDVVSGEQGIGSYPVQGMYGNMLQNNFISLNVSNDTYYWSVQTIDSSLKTSAWSTEQEFNVAGDTTAPTISIVYPVNNTNVSAGTTWTWVNITTNENATCQYNESGGFVFGTNGTNFTSSNNTFHYFNYSNFSIGLANETMHTLYYKCNDTGGNIMSTPTVHRFGVNKSVSDEDITPPSITIIYPQDNSNLSAGTTWTWINITTNENATCQYNESGEFIFDTNGTNFTYFNNTFHYFNYSNYSIGLINGSSYSFYYKCNDTVGNINPSSTTHTFSVGESIEISGCQDLDIANEKYKLTQDISSTSTCINVLETGITLDCQGYRIEGNGDTGDTTYGINITEQTRANISNCTLFNFTAGIYLESGNHSTFSNLNLTNNSESGISVSKSVNNTIFLSSITYNTNQGVSLDAAHNHTFYNNTFLNPTSGAGSYTDINFQMTSGSNSEDTLIYLNSITDSDCLGTTTNADRINLNNSQFGNFWTSKDEPTEGCYDTNVDGFCDDIYNFTAESAGGGGDEQFNDYLPLRKSDITAGISISLITSTGAGQNNDSAANGYIVANDIANYFINIINSQNSADHITINTTNYNNIGTIIVNQSSFEGVPAYGKVSFTINVTDSAIGTYIVGINTTTNDTDYTQWLNLTTKVIETFKDDATWETNLNGVITPAIASGDVDNDSDFDLIIIGENSNSKPIANVYINDGSTFNVNSTWSKNITNVTSPSTALADIDNDGWLDLIVAGSDINSSASTEVYINNRSGFIQNTTWSQNITPKQSASIAVGDINLDGKIDMVLVGYNNSDPTGIESKVYINNGTTFNENHAWQKNLTGMYKGSANLFDVDNDTYLDLLIVGEDENNNLLTEVYISNTTTLVYNSSYSLGFNNYQTQGSGNHMYTTIADFDNDGSIDIAIFGQINGGDKQLDIYLNNQTSFNYNSSWTSGLTFQEMGMVYPGDYDNNGNIDLVYMPAGTTGDSVLALNNTGESFVEDSEFKKFLPNNNNAGTGIMSGTALLVDVDSDNNLDIVLSGDESGASAEIYTAELASDNTAPSAPTSFANSYGDSLDINWSGATDTEGGTLYYNLRVGTSSGANDIVSRVYGSASNPSQGMFGNMLTGDNIQLNISKGTYYWAVQTIDSSFTASDWSAEQTYVPTTYISSCQNLDSESETYRLTQDIENETGCFDIQANDIILDCQGHQIQGDGTSSTYAGINITGRTNIIVRNCTILNFSYGIYLYDTNLSDFSNLTVNNNSDDGIYLYFANDNSINTSYIEYNTNYGLYFDGSSGNEFYNNTINNNVQTNIYFDNTNNRRNNDTLFVTNTFMDSSTLNSLQNTNNLMLNNSDYGNVWTAKDEPSEGCFDANTNVICDEIYNLSTQGNNQDAGDNHVIDYLPIRKSEITAGINITIDEATGVAQYGNDDFDGYATVGNIETYYVKIINNQDSNENITINFSNYNGFDTLVANQTSFEEVSAYSRTSFIVNISDANVGTFVLGMNATTNDSNYNNWLNVSTKIIEAFKEQTTWQTNINGGFTNAITSGDVDNDDDLDLIVIGNDGNGNAIANVYINDGSTFNVNSTWSKNITNVTSASSILTDINNDGWLDLIVSGTDVNDFASTEIYINNQSMFVENSTWSQNITPKQQGSIAVGDINLDGKIDMVLIGINYSIGGVNGLESKVYVNNGTALHENNGWQKNLTAMYNGAANLFDVDNDTYLDLLLVGGDENDNIYAEIYINNKSTFVYNSSYSLGISQNYELPTGSTNLLYTAIGDYNNDAWMDIAIQGRVSSETKLDIYFNNQTSFDYNSNWTSGLTFNNPGMLYPGDYNNNGKIDLIFTIASTASDDLVLLNNTGVNFTEDFDFEKFLPTSNNAGSSIGSGSCLFADYDGDNNLDLVLIGDISGASAKIYTGELSSNNDLPSAPTSVINNYHDDGLNLSWSGASDTQGGTLYYNIKVGNSSGSRNIVSGKYGLGSSPAQGMYGNMITATGIMLNVTNQTYYWSVQTIDSSLKASAWSSESNTADTSAPTITIDNPENNSYTTSGRTWQWINLTTSEIGNCQYNNSNDFEFNVNGTNFDTSGTTKHFLNLTGLTDGSTHTLYFRCNDTHGNENNVSSILSFKTKYGFSNCSNLTTSNMIYELNSSIENAIDAKCINAYADDITIDCQGMVIDGQDNADTYGIYMNGSNSVTITNCTITDFYDGIFVNLSSNNSQITNNNFTSNKRSGIYFGNDFSSYRDNNISSNVFDSQELSTGYDIYLIGLYNNISSNNFSSTNIMQNIYVKSDTNTNNNIINSNRFSDSGNYTIYIGNNSNYNIISNNLMLSSYDFGIYLNGSDYNLIQDNNITSHGNTSFDAGIILTLGATYNNITNNTFKNNFEYAIFFNTSADNNSIVWKNNFINNQTGHYIYDNASINFYNLSNRGNYWDVYDDSDEGCVETDDDGICDSSFTGDNAGKVIDYHAYTSINGWLLGRPTVTEYNTSLGSTNFSALDNTTDVPNLTLANVQGKIRWTNQIVNAEEQDFDLNIEIGDEFVVVNTSQLHSSLNTSADITIKSVNCSGFKPLTDLVYTEQDYSTKADIQTYGKSCPTSVCSNIACIGGVLNFTVAHFTGYAFGGNANLTISDSHEGSSVDQGTNATFYANYTNSTGHLIQSASCNVTFEDGAGSWYQMTQDGNKTYNYSKSFATGGTLSWNVTCDHDDYTELNANDTISVVGGSESISSCQTLSSSGTTYTLTQNVADNDTCFEVTANNVALDCSGYNIIGNGTTPIGNPTINADEVSSDFFTGVKLQSVTGFNMTNCTVLNFTDGIFMNYSNLSRIEDSNITNNTLRGIVLNLAHNNTIKSTDFSLNSYYSIEIYASHYTTIVSNWFHEKLSSAPSAGEGQGLLNAIDIGGFDGAGGTSNYTLIYKNEFENFTSLSRICVDGHYTMLDNGSIGNRWGNYDDLMDYVLSDGYRDDPYYDAEGYADGCFDADDDVVCDNVYNLTRISDSNVGSCDDDGAAYGIDYYPEKDADVNWNNITLFVSNQRGVAYYWTDAITQGPNPPSRVVAEGYVAANSDVTTSEIGSNYTVYLVNNDDDSRTLAMDSGGALVPHYTGYSDTIDPYTIIEITLQVSPDADVGLTTQMDSITVDTDDGSGPDDSVQVRSNLIQAFMPNSGPWFGTGEGAFQTGGNGIMMAAGDVDRNNYTDILVFSGPSPTAQTDTDYLYAHVLTNNLGNGFHNEGWAENITPVSHGSMTLADINNDLWLDLIVAGSTHPTGGGNDTVHVYINDHTKFRQNLTWSQNITPGSQPSIITGDIDLDGKVDLIVQGSYDDGGGGITPNPTLVYINNGTSFVQDAVWSAHLDARDDGFINLVDVNNDHYLDLITSGDDHVDDVYGPFIWINNGTTFEQNQTWDNGGNMGLPASPHNNIAFADLNNDNWMDMVVLGGWAYINNKSTLVRDESWDDNLTGDITFLGDYDNDGDIDLLTDRPGDNGNEIITYYNNGSSLLIDNQSNKFVTSLNVESAIFGDFDGDGNIDMLAAEEETVAGDDDYNELLMFLNYNNDSNTAPSDPTGFTAVYDGGIDVEWAGATDPEGGPTYYNIRIGTTDGGHDVISPAYGYSADPAQGMYGNMQTINSTLFNIPQETNTFYLGVQAIDTGFEKSNWSETTITYVADVRVVQVGGVVTTIGEEYISSGGATEDVISEILEHVDAEDLGLIEVSKANVDVTVEDRIIEEEETTTDVIAEVLEQEVNEVVSEELRLLRTGIERQIASPVRVKKTLTSYKIKAKETEKSIDVTLIEAKIKAGEPITGFTLVEAIPKSMAEHIREVNFIGILPIKILQADPIVKFYFERINKNEEKKVKYLINKKIETLNTKSIAVYENIPILRESENRSIKVEKWKMTQVALGNETLNITVDELEEDFVVINIKGGSYRIDLGKSKDIDLDKDGKTDITVLLLSSKFGQAKITLRKVMRPDEGKYVEEGIRDKIIKVPVALLNMQSFYMAMGTLLLLLISYLSMHITDNKANKEYLVKRKKEKRKKKQQKIRKIKEKIKKKKIRKKKGGSLGIMFSKLKKLLLSLKAIHIKVKHKRRIKKSIKNEKILKKQHKKIRKKIEKHRIRKSKGLLRKAIEKHRKAIISIIIIILGVLLIGSLITLVYYFIDYSKLVDLALRIKESIIRMIVQSEEELYSPFYIYHIMIGIGSLVIVIAIINLVKAVTILFKRKLKTVKTERKKRDTIKRKKKKQQMLKKLMLVKTEMKRKRQENKRIRQERKKKRKLERMRKREEKRKKKQEEKRKRKLEKIRKQEEKNRKRSTSERERKRIEKKRRKEKRKKEKQEQRERKRKQKKLEKERRIREKERKRKEKELERIKAEKRKERKIKTKQKQEQEKSIQQRIAAKKAEKAHKIRKRKQFKERYGEFIKSSIIIISVIVLAALAIYYIEFSKLWSFISKLKTSIITTLSSANYLSQIIIGVGILAAIILIIQLIKAMPVLIKKECKILERFRRIRKRQKEIRKRRKEEKEKRKKQRERLKQIRIEKKKKKKKRRILNKLKSIRQGIKDNIRKKRLRRIRIKNSKRKEKERKKKERKRIRNIRKRKRLEEKRRKQLSKSIKKGKQRKKELREQRKIERQIRQIRAARKATKEQRKRKRERFFKKYGQLIIILILISLIIVVGYHINYSKLIDFAIASLSSTNYVYHIIIGLVGLLILLLIINIIKIVFRLFKGNKDKIKKKDIKRQRTKKKTKRKKKDRKKKSKKDKKRGK